MLEVCNRKAGIKCPTRNPFLKTELPTAAAPRSSQATITKGYHLDVQIA
jgi:hypothetical protein